MLAVRGSIAEDEALRADALAFHFAAHARGTAAEGARLELELQHVGAHCAACEHAFRPEHHLHLCPRCGSTDVHLDGPTGVHLDGLEVSDS